MKLISYAQNCEDIMLWRALKHIANGFYIDIGAGDPVVDSVTKLFYDRGWRGINIEPLESHYNDLIKARPEDINIKCAIGEANKTAKIWVSKIRGHSSLDENVVNKQMSLGQSGHYQICEVQTLSAILAKHVAGDIHFMKVDVEGYEREVLASTDWIKHRPWVILCESISPLDNKEMHEEFEPILLAANYEFIYADGLNRFYLAKERQEISHSFKYPPNIFDEYTNLRMHLLEERLDTLEQNLKLAEDKVNIYKIIRPKRIFWLGMHKLLVTTELPKLRELGYEVFNPAYLSAVKDQSANLAWDENQPSTLPKDIFNRLSSFNFFYNNIPDDIINILNEYFDAFIVTISPEWLAPILNSYKGKIIYRTYGQHYLLSEELKRKKLLFEIAKRDNFTFMPHASEALYGEHAWLKEIAVVTPYCLDQDIFKHQDTWEDSKKRNKEIIITCPNISNPFFNEHYRYLKKNFSESFFSYFGVQMSDINDPQVVGTLPRQEQILRFQSAAGYLYTYTDERVCYLPPIEMMVIGGPVLFMEGSLLEKYYDTSAPGKCHSIQEAKEKTARLLNNDKPFIDAIIASQEKVKRRYHPSYVWPIFEKNIQESINYNNPASHWVINTPTDLYSDEPKRIYLLHHFPGQPIIFDGANYSAYDGIPRVMRAITNILNQNCEYEIVVTARYDQAEQANGYFNYIAAKSKQKIQILVIDSPSEGEQNDNTPVETRIKKLKAKTKSLLKKYIPQQYWPAAIRAKIIMSQGLRHVKSFYLTLFKQSAHPELNAKNIPEYIKKINMDNRCHKVIVPHYYWFPESIHLEKEIFLYLPDYVPYFFQQTGEFKNEEQYADIGKKIAEKARVIFCNSNFTKKYLPDTALAIKSEKIRVFYLPNLNIQQQGLERINELPEGLIKYEYIFYPTQPRPNKNLPLLLKIFQELIERGHKIKLVLTNSLEANPKTYLLYQSLPCKDKIAIMKHISDDMMATLYRNAALLCLTSLAEGNFPPQIHEALFYETPVVASNLGFITERIPANLIDSISLCESNNSMAFIKACEAILLDRTNFVLRQKQLRSYIENSSKHFYQDVLELFE